MCEREREKEVGESDRVLLYYCCSSSLPSNIIHNTARKEHDILYTIISTWMIQQVDPCSIM